MDAVLAAERALGRTPSEMPHNNPGYDIESRDPAKKQLLFIEVKGKASGMRTVTISKTQILTGLNKPDEFILAVVEVDGDAARSVRYLRQPFTKELDFAVTSVNFDLGDLMERAEDPT
jgi:hypothetical protein